MFRFGRIRQLERENEELREKYRDLLDRVSYLECAATERVGAIRPLDAYAMGCGAWKDNRPKLTAMQAIRMVMDHLGLKIHTVEATNQRFELIAPQKGKK